jgi:hypothetical protein
MDEWIEKLVSGKLEEQKGTARLDIFSTLSKEKQQWQKGQNHK